MMNRETFQTGGAVATLERPTENEYRVYKMKVLDFEDFGRKGQTFYKFSPESFDESLSAIDSGEHVAIINGEHDTNALASTEVPEGKVGFAKFYTELGSLWAEFSPIQTSRGRDVEIGIDSGVINSASVEISYYPDSIHFYNIGEREVVEYSKVDLMGAAVVANPSFRDTELIRLKNNVPEEETKTSDSSKETNNLVVRLERLENEFELIKTPTKEVEVLEEDEPKGFESPEAAEAEYYRLETEQEKT